MLFIYITFLNNMKTKISFITDDHFKFVALANVEKESISISQIDNPHLTMAGSLVSVSNPEKENPKIDKMLDLGKFPKEWQPILGVPNVIA